MSDLHSPKHRTYLYWGMNLLSASLQKQVV
ncbi:Uncharacterised protein [Vibrio cholerae]|nr:Uncharacterised protein [Vibrio cholerae]